MPRRSMPAAVTSRRSAAMPAGSPTSAGSFAEGRLGVAHPARVTPVHRLRNRQVVEGNARDPLREVRARLLRRRQIERADACAESVLGHSEEVHGRPSFSGKSRLAWAFGVDLIRARAQARDRISAEALAIGGPVAPRRCAGRSIAPTDAPRASVPSARSYASAMRRRHGNETHPLAGLLLPPLAPGTPASARAPRGGAACPRNRARVAVRATGVRRAGDREARRGATARRI